MNVPEYPTVHHIPLQENAAPTQVLFAGDTQELDADIVVPVYNEEVELGSSIMILVEQLKVLENLPEPISAQVVIADTVRKDLAGMRR